MKRIRQPLNIRFNSTFITSTVKNYGEKIFLWDCFSYQEYLIQGHSSECNTAKDNDFSMLEILILIRTPKLSNVERGQYLDG